MSEADLFRQYATLIILSFALGWIISDPALDVQADIGATIDKSTHPTPIRSSPMEFRQLRIST